MNKSTIAVINASSVLKDSEIESSLPALQDQITGDFCSTWDKYADLKFIPSTGLDQEVDPSYWQMVILDNSDVAGALGYHDMTKSGMPLGKVFAGTDLKYGNSWTVTLSHELLEMLADPWINLYVIEDNDLCYPYEVCDAVEADSLGYKIGSVLTSNFVYPSWFHLGSKPPYDRCGLLTRPFEIEEGGYASVMHIGSGKWIQLSPGENKPDQRARVGSRRERRKTRDQWMLSTR